MKIAKPRKKVSRKYLKKKADTVFSKKVRSKGFCELEGLDDISCNGNLQTMHIYGRANMRLRYDPFNVLCGCQAHHLFYTYHPFDFYELIKTKFKHLYKYLQKHKDEILKVNYYKVIERYKEA